jgi:ribosomal protein S18 acetylase RimI-like enzyme
MCPPWPWPELLDHTEKYRCGVAESGLGISDHPAHPRSQIWPGQTEATKPKETPAVKLRVRLGTPDDKDAIISLINQAAQWLSHDIGTNQWAKPWPDVTERDERVVRGLEERRTWIVDEDEDTSDPGYLPAATITCRAEANPKLWNEQEQDAVAVYVSRLIVNRDYAHRHIGQELLDLAGKWARERYGARWIRIDVWTTNVALQGYYERDGFQFVRFCDDVDYPSAALFQRPTEFHAWQGASRLSDPPPLLVPFQKFEIPREAAARPPVLPQQPQLRPMSGLPAMASHPQLQTAQGSTGPGARAQRHRRGRSGRTRLRLIDRCAYATKRSLYRCCRRLLVPGLRHSHQRHEPTSGQQMALAAEANANAVPAAR